MKIPPVLKALLPAVILFIVVCIGLFVWGWYSFSSTEKPPYTVVQELAEGMEVREYGKQTLITAESANDNSAFRYLGGYIFGGNEREQEIAMTAPVVTQAKGDVIEMSFILPEGVTIDNAPRPNSEKVRISEIGKKTYAVIQFSGATTQKSVMAQRNLLAKEMQKAGLKPIAQPMLWRYNDPWTPLPMRTNEIAIEVNLE